MGILIRSLLTLALLAGQAGVAHAQIIPIESNNLYYEKIGGEDLVLTGYGSIVPVGLDWLGRDLAEQLRVLTENGIRYARVWHMCGDVPDHRPWQATQIRDTEKWRFDFATWNEQYWAKFREALRLANENRIVVEVHLFDRSGVGWDPNGECPQSAEYLADKFQDEENVWQPRMEQYVEKLISESQGFDNVIYEVDQESRIPDAEWHAYWARFVKSRLSNPARVVAITPPKSELEGLAKWGENHQLDAVDTINLHSDNPNPDTDMDMVAYLQGKRARIKSIRTATGKAVCFDEFGNGMTNEDHLRMMAWTFVASGAHFHLEDVEEHSESIALNVAGAVEDWKDRSYWELEHFKLPAAGDAPVLSGGVVSFCTKGVWYKDSYTEYLCYVPTVPLGGNAINVTLPPPPAGFGGWVADVWNPRAVPDGPSQFYSESRTSLPVTLRSDEGEWKSDWVLVIYTRPEYTLAVTRGGAGAGTVTSSPAGIDCGADCTEKYLNGTVVSLSASPAAGSRFAGWGGGCAAAPNPCQVTMIQARSISAFFEPLPHPLSVTLSGAGSVTSSPAGIDCGADCTENYGVGTVVSLSASPAAGWGFAGWGGDCTGAPNPCLVTMDRARSVSALFKLLPTYLMSVTLSGTGSVTSDPTGIACGQSVREKPGPCAATYASGTLVTLNAVPGPAAAFSGWSGACSGTQASCKVTMKAAQAVTASFVPFSGLLYNPLPLPCRVVDTRSGSPLAHGRPVAIQVAGLCGVPAAARAVAAMVAAVGPTAQGHIAMDWPAHSTAVANFPSASTAWASSAVFSLPDGGAVTTAAYLADAGTTHLVIDVTGYFVPTNVGGQSYQPLVPSARFLDTRTLSDPLPAGTERIYQTAGFGGLPSSATALALSASILGPQNYGNLRLYPADRGLPSTSFLNYRPGDAITNGGIVAVSPPTGRLAAFSTQGGHLVVDVHGAFVPAPATKYFPIAPCRVLDTRVTGRRVSGSLSFRVGGTCGIPDDAAAVAANFAVVSPLAAGYLTLAPTGYAPAVAQLLYQAGWTISSGALVSLYRGSVTASAPVTTDLVFDVTGYFR